jgi:hypothetical protein
MKPTLKKLVDGINVTPFLAVAERRAIDPVSASQAV